MSDADLVASLRERVLDEVGRAIPPGPVALIDFPNYANPGDSAIWLGTLACLAALGRSMPVYTSDHRTFNDAMLRASLPHHGTILLPGGGNLGDLWPGAQVLRERVLREFPDRAIVQLPQTVHFSARDSLEQARCAFDSHPNVTILARDAPSVEAATTGLGCTARLCPDLAFCLARDSEPALRATAAEPHVDVLLLLRGDHEGQEHVVRDTRQLHSARIIDWVSDLPTIRRRIDRALGDLILRGTRDGRRTFTARIARRIDSALYPALARHRLRAGVALLRSARVVITDRLHGHVLALLLGIPHVVLGDRHGKVRSFLDAWTSRASNLCWADTMDEAVMLAAEMLRRRPLAV